MKRYWIVIHNFKKEKNIKLKHIIIYEILTYIDYMLMLPVLFLALLLVLWNAIYLIFLEIYKLPYQIIYEIRDIRRMRWLISWWYADKLEKIYK